MVNGIKKRGESRNLADDRASRVICARIHPRSAAALRLLASQHNASLSGIVERLVVQAFEATRKRYPAVDFAPIDDLGDNLVGVSVNDEKAASRAVLEAMHCAALAKRK